ncbi:envelope glycoprotein [Vespertilionid gammaherpesvirus 1]|uniref:Envelope glycoprotein n=1 Tax=Vespertilionid gammaherpesvirus 1 TaxID=2560830 RepID=A0A109QBA0_9GAMA|nr:envelope glycoprotein [Myotis gammaherpesvirus 8]AMA67407.1 envelope glycoprotein [Vespertilionid gammaherpesvirus 1]
MDGHESYPCNLNDTTQVSIFYVSYAYWFIFNGPVFRKFPICSKCNYTTTLETTWSNSSEQPATYTTETLELPSINSNFMDSNVTLSTTPTTKNALIALFGTDGKIGIITQGPFEKTHTPHSIIVKVTNPFGVTWCKKTTVTSANVPNKLLINLEKITSECTQSPSELVITNGEFSVSLPKIKFSTTSNQFLIYIISSKYNITCKLTVRVSDRLMKNDIVLNTVCNSGTLNTKIVATSYPEVTKVQNILHSEFESKLTIQGAHEYLQAKNILISFETLGRPQQKTLYCSRFTNLTYIHKPFGFDNSIVPIKDIYEHSGNASITLDVPVKKTSFFYGGIYTKNSGNFSCVWISTHPNNTQICDPGIEGHMSSNGKLTINMTGLESPYPEYIMFLQTVNKMEIYLLNITKFISPTIHYRSAPESTVIASSSESITHEELSRTYDAHTPKEPALTPTPTEELWTGDVSTEELPEATLPEPSPTPKLALKSNWLMVLCICLIVVAVMLCNINLWIQTQNKHRREYTLF